jgi:syndecan 1
MTADGGERSLGAPRFDVVLRGYDRRQVDEHVARLQRVLARMRADLDAARSHPFPAVGPRPGMGGPMGPPPGPYGAPPPQPGPPGARPRPTPGPRPGQPDAPDMIGPFTDRMQSILQAAEEEAEEVRGAARREARAERESAQRESEGLRTELAELNRQRDAVVAELTRLRGQLEGMLGAPTAKLAATTPSSRSEPPPEAAATTKTPRPSPRPKPRAEAEETSALPRPDAAATSALPRPEAGDLFRPASDTPEKPEAPRIVEPDRTVAVSQVRRSGDTGSDEKSRSAATNTPSDTPDTKSDGERPPAQDEVTETVKVSAVRPGPGSGEASAPPRNGRSGRPEERREGAMAGERTGVAAAEGAARSDRSSSGSRSG